MTLKPRGHVVPTLVIYCQCVQLHSNEPLYNLI